MSDKIRVLRVIGRLNVGGPAIHAVLLTERLDPSRYASVLLTGTESPDEGNHFALHGRSLSSVKVIPTSGGRPDWRRDGTALLELYRCIKSYRPHIVHTHTAKAGVLGRLAARCAGVPVVVHTYHGHILDGYFSPLKTRAILSVERALAHLTDRILSVSDTVRHQLIAKRIGRPDQHNVVPLGLDLEPLLTAERWRGRLRQELGLTPTDALIGIVARLVPIKRHEVFFQAAKQVIAEIPRSHFVVVGDGQRRRELEELVRGLGLERHVRFLGWRADLPEIYADLDVVVLSSRNEGSPVSLIEAMAAARPVVATRVGGIPDLVEDQVNGLLVPADDPRSLAQAMVALLSNAAQRQALGAAGRERVYPAFSAPRLLQDMDKLYEELVGEKRVRDVARNGPSGTSSPAGETAPVSVPTRADGPPEYALKRPLDAVLAAVGLILSAPAWLILAGAIRLEDRGPLFYRQERWGKGGTRFRALKFRSMVVALDGASGRVQATKGDPRITRVGRLMRKAALDELPQLINILQGDMSFVGPRALPINEVQRNDRHGDLPDDQIEGFAFRCRARPGLTGVAQLYAPRDIARRHKFRYDAVYVRRQSLALDLRLILRSLWISLTAGWERYHHAMDGKGGKGGRATQ